MQEAGIGNVTEQQTTIAKIRELELSLHRPEVRASRERVGRLLADDFMEFGSSGRVYDKRTIIDVLAQETGETPPPAAEDFAVRFLSDTIALATYRTLRPTRQILRCSVWRQDAEGWRMIFHQGTPTNGA